MKKIILIGLLVISAYASNAQVVDAKQVRIADSLRLKTDWITSILKDSSLVGASAKNLPTSDAAVKYIANRLKYDVKYGDTAALVAGYVRINRMLDSLAAVQLRVQSKLTKSDADTYYPAIQRLIDSATAIQSRVQSKLTKSDADTYYPAIQRLIDSATAIQSRIQTKQPLLGYTAENVANKATDFTTVNNTLYPTVQAAKSYADGLVAGLLNDRGNYDPSGNAFPSTGGSGTSGAIKKGNIWYITTSGLLGSDSVHKGDWIRALVDAPGTTASNWGIVQGNLGYTPENKGNKSVNTSLGTSDNLYPSQNAVKVYVDAAVANGNTAYSWGNHASAGYSTASNTQTFTNKTWNGVAIANAYLANSSVTINGTVFSLGGSGSIINGTGFVKASGTTISYDNSTYLTTSSASSSYVPYTGATGLLDLGSYGLRSDFAQFYGGNFSVVRSATSGSATMFFATGNRTAAPVDWSVGVAATTSNFQVYNYGTSHVVIDINRSTDATAFYGAVNTGGDINGGNFIAARPLSGNDKKIYLFNNGSILKLDAYNYTTSSPLDVQIGGNGGTIQIAGNLNAATNSVTGGAASFSTGTFSGSVKINGSALSFPLNVKYATNQQFYATGDGGTGIEIGAINDAASANVPLKIAGSTITLTGPITVSGTGGTLVNTTSAVNPAGQTLVWYNSSSTGYGPYFSGGDATHDALTIVNYDRSIVALKVYGDGQVIAANKFFSSTSGTDAGMYHQLSGYKKWFTGSGTSGWYVANVTDGLVMASISNAGAGLFYGSVTATAFYESSDLRQKRIINRFHSADGIDAIDYVFKPTGQQKYGYGAQWVQTVLPFAVTKGSDGFLKVDYTSVFTYKISMLEKRIAQIEKSKK